MAKGNNHSYRLSMFALQQGIICGTTALCNGGTGYRLSMFALQPALDFMSQARSRLMTICYRLSMFALQPCSHQICTRLAVYSPSYRLSMFALQPYASHQSARSAATPQVTA